MDARIGIIGGHGWLGSAIASALVASGLTTPDRIALSGRSGGVLPAALEGAFITRDNQDLVDRSGIVILSVRPDQFPDVSINAGQRLVISVMGCVSAETIAARTGSAQVVRAMPNAATGIRRSFTPWFAAPAVTADNRAAVQAICEALGGAAEVPKEAHIDYCVAMTGTGAAFPALLAKALIEHAVAQGLPAEFAEQAAVGMVADASQLLHQPGNSPATVVDEMIAYAGITAAGLSTMIDNGLIRVVAAGIDAAAAKSMAHLKTAETETA